MCAGDSSAEAAELRKACQLNQASCYLNTGRAQTVVQLCTDVLELDPGNRKARHVGTVFRAFPALTHVLLNLERSSTSS
jgi:hypothetical protein